MYEPNIYVNNSKFISIVDNVNILLLPLRPFLYRRKFAQSLRALIVSRRWHYAKVCASRLMAAAQTLA